MKIGIFPMDGYDLFWTDGEEKSLLMLNFDMLEDAVWARQVFENFIAGKTSCPRVVTQDNGDVEVYP